MMMMKALICQENGQSEDRLSYRDITLAASAVVGVGSD